MDKELQDKEVIRNLQNDLQVCRNLYAEYRKVTDAQFVIQNSVIANLIKENEELKLIAKNESIPLLIRLGEFIENSQDRIEIITKLKEKLGIL
jgi:hypothetical protein